MKHQTNPPDNLRARIEELEKRIQDLETRDGEMETRLRKLSDDVLTADNYHGKIQTETIRHDF